MGDQTMKITDKHPLPWRLDDEGDIVDASFGMVGSLFVAQGDEDLGWPPADTTTRDELMTVFNSGLGCVRSFGIRSDKVVPTDRKALTDVTLAIHAEIVETVRHTRDDFTEELEAHGAPAELIEKAINVSLLVEAAGLSMEAGKSRIEFIDAAKDAYDTLFEIETRRK